ncbi:hypothetical protein GFM44_23040 [Rhizobium leguminosarum bv. viciae]|nr:hypothetical protein [Rhizobium leguminosarum bv. viciae]
MTGGIWGKDPAMAATMELAGLITPFHDSMQAPLRPLPERPSYSVEEVMAYRAEINRQREEYNRKGSEAVANAQATFEKLKSRLLDVLGDNLALRNQLDQVNTLLAQQEAVLAQQSAALAEREAEIEVLLDLQDAVRERLASGHPNPMDVLQDKIAAS